MSNEIIDKYGKQLGLSGIGLMTYLSRRADGEGKSFPSINTIKKDTGMGSYNTIKKYIKLLENLGLLRKWLVPGKEYANYHYQILNRVMTKKEQALHQKVSTKEYSKKEYPFKNIKNKYKNYLYGTYQEYTIYKFPDGYKTLNRDNKFVYFGGELNDIKKSKK